MPSLVFFLVEVPDVDRVVWVDVEIAVVDVAANSVHTLEIGAQSSSGCSPTVL